MMDKREAEGCLAYARKIRATLERNGVSLAKVNALIAQLEKAAK